MEYTVLMHPAEEGGYWSEVPALPCCFSQGETIEEALTSTTPERRSRRTSYP